MSKIPGLKKPTAVGAIATPAKEEATVSPKDGDPIGQSLEARDQKLGGLANQVTDAEAKKKGISVYRAAKHPTLKGGVEIDFAGKKENSKEAESTPNSARGRPSTAATKGTP